MEAQDQPQEAFRVEAKEAAVKVVAPVTPRKLVNRTSGNLLRWLMLCSHSRGFMRGHVPTGTGIFESRTLQMNPTV